VDLSLDNDSPPSTDPAHFSGWKPSGSCQSCRFSWGLDTILLSKQLRS